MPFALEDVQHYVVDGGGGNPMRFIDAGSEITNGTNGISAAIHVSTLSGDRVSVMEGTINVYYNILSSTLTSYELIHFSTDIKFESAISNDIFTIHEDAGETYIEKHTLPAPMGLSLGSGFITPTSTGQWKFVDQYGTIIPTTLIQADSDLDLGLGLWKGQSICITTDLLVSHIKWNTENHSTQLEINTKYNIQSSAVDKLLHVELIDSESALLTINNIGPVLDTAITLSVRQLRDIKKLAHLLGSTNMGMVSESAVTLSVDGSKVLDDIPGNAAGIIGDPSSFSNPVDNDVSNSMGNLTLDGDKHNITWEGSFSYHILSYFYGISGTHLFSQGGNHSTSVLHCSEGGIVAKGGISVYSDRRIKENIEDVPDALALEQVRQIPCRYYEYADKISGGPAKTIGFIAQEVKEVLPSAVKTRTGFIPDHMRIGEVSWEEVDGKHMMTVSNLDADVASGTNMQFAASTGIPTELNEDGSVKTPASDDFSACKKKVIMREDGKFEMDKVYDSVFIIGREVDDLNILDKQKIFALHHAAIQELDKTVEAQNAPIAILEQQYAAQQTDIDALMARVAALEGQ
jgi:hypothetical protein